MDRVRMCILAAMADLERIPCAIQVGANGPTKAELIEYEDSGQVYHQDAVAHDCQWAWWNLNDALVALKEAGNGKA